MGAAWARHAMCESAFGHPPSIFLVSEFAPLFELGSKIQTSGEVKSNEHFGNIFISLLVPSDSTESL